MQCIKTGCAAYIDNYGEFIHGDAFLSPSGDLVIRVCQIERQPISNRRHFSVLEDDHWFDRDKTGKEVHSSTLIVAKGMFQNHGYEGIDEPQLAAT